MNLRSNRYFSVFVLFIITRIIAIFCAIPYFTDTEIYFNYFIKLDYGLAPYSQFNFEYPPLSLIPIYLAGKLFSESFIIYCISFSIILFAIDYLCLELCSRYCKDRLNMDKKAISRMSLFYVFFGFTAFRLIYQRLDIIVALTFAISLLLFRASETRIRISFATNAFLGFFYKIIPALTMPVALILKERKILRIARSSAIFLICIMCAIWLMEIITNHSFIANMFYHQERGIQIESLYSSLILFTDLVLGQKSTVISGYGCDNIAAAPWLESFSKIFGHLALLIFYAALFFKFRKKKKISEENFLEATIITILIFLSFQRILSPQFFIWLIPALSIWLAKNYSIEKFLTCTTLFFLTWIIFSLNYYYLIDLEPAMIVILLLRNLVLVSFTIFMIIKFFRNE